MLIVSYYNFGIKAVEKAREILLHDGDILDAVEKGINVIEEDETIRSVGIGGLPNFEGEVELDAAIMDGRSLKCGAVAAVKRVKYPISLARKVMEETPHVFIVGDNALKLAKFFRMEEIDLPLKESYEEYLKKKKEVDIKGYDKESFRHLAEDVIGHDTIGVIAFKEGFAAGVSSSGLGLKIPGRVGDSPIIGAGLYASNEDGAAICTGVGEIAIRLVAAKTSLDLLKLGYSAQESAREVIRRVNEIRRRENMKYSLGIVVVDKDLNIGAAANYKFKYVYWNSNDSVEILFEDADFLPP